MPALYSPDGVRYRTEDPLEVTRLKAIGYTDTRKRPPTIGDLQFHPDDHSVDEVLTYVAEHPAEAERVIAEEKAGKARVTLVGKSENTEGEPA
jgi:hypothetical protein